MDLGVDTILPQKPPDVRFIARFHPPVLVPLQTAINIFNSVGVQEAIQPTTYDSLLLPDEDGTPSLSTTERVVEREVYGPSDDDAGSIASGGRHRYTLFTDAQAYARNIEEIPFAHPRQIVALLPVLRQWVFVSSLLRRCFQPSSEQGNGNPDVSNNDVSPVSASDSDSDSDPSDSDSSFDHDGRTFPIRGFTNEMKTFPNGEPSSSPSRLQRATPIDISLSLSGPAPRFDLIFPHKVELASIAFSVEANAEIADVEILLGAGADGNEKMDGEEDLEARMKKRKEAVKRVLELSEDLGVLVRWIGRGFEGEMNGERVVPR